MLKQHPAGAAGVGDPPAVEQLVDDFESAWQSGTPPALDDYLPTAVAAGPPAAGHRRRELLQELVKIDLEYRWRSPAPEGADPAESPALPPRPRLEDYVGHLTDLGPLPELAVELVGEEYRVRQRWGDRPAHAEYAERFPWHGSALRRELARVDAELAAESARGTRKAPGEGGPRAAGPAPPRRLGRYHLEGLLGTGAFGSVWLAWDTDLARAVAVKVPRSGRFASPEEEERFLREARSAAQLHHEGIVAVHDVGRTAETVYIVSELVRGANLAEQLRGGWPGFAEAAEVVAQVADALDYAHQQGVVHRDVKPSNIMLEPGEAPGAGRRARVMDFGLALRETGEATLTRAGDLLGTPAYMSPEQICDPHGVDGRSDVYSLGVILYELLTGRLPFPGVTHTQLLPVLAEEPRPPRRLNAWVPPDLETICLKCLAKERGRRYRTAAALAADLRRWLAGEPIRARPVGRTERLWLWVKRNPASVAAGALAAAAAVAFAGTPAALALAALALAAVLVALYKAKAAADLSRAVEDLRRRRQEAGAALQFAVKQCGAARAERDRALAAEARARARLGPLRELARAFLFDLPGALTDQPGAAAARALFVRTALAYLDGLAKHVGDDDVQRRELAVAYARVAAVQAEPDEADAPDSAGALASYEKSLDLFVALAAAHPDNAQARRDVAAGRVRVAELRRALGR